MMYSKQIAKHFNEVMYGGNWTASNVKDAVADVTWQQASQKVGSFNTIAALVLHINYYVAAIIEVLKGNSLEAHDSFSFNHLPVTCDDDWQALLNKTWSDANAFITLVEALPDHQLEAIFYLEKYGTYYRNLHGVIEHTHYHLGQIVLLKKLL